MRRATIRTAFDSAVFAIPTGHTETGAVLALAMLIAACIAQLRVAVFATPFGIASAGVTHTTTMLTAIQITKLLRAVVATPLRFAGACLCVDVEAAVVRAVGQALQRILVYRSTIGALPTFLTNARAISAEAMPRAVGMRAVNWK